ncbi:SpoIIE family protein phosphatase [Streptomyces lonarensis]|uniref:SpoIIE family protein phosphatase n=1 Tax=Streptomyces lonarensis TaxID=700599 RepID=UPI0028A93D46|nr:SpoIIE family protein phosphatase [Streptomyces lonarensis]
MSTSTEEPRRSQVAAVSPHADLSLLDALRLGLVIIDGRGRIALWNPATEEILGWPGREAVGRPLTDFLAPPGMRHVPRATRALLRHGAWRGVLPMLSREGTVVDVECRATLLRDPQGAPFFLANLVETSRLREVEQDLGALDTVFATSPIGIAVFDTDLRVARINDALASLYGRTPEQVVGRTVMELLPPQAASEIYELQREVLATGRPAVDVVALTADGRGAHSLSFGRLTDRHGNHLGVSCVTLDITERREALDKIEQSRQRLSMLNDVGLALGDRLDVHSVAEALAGVLVPRFTDYAAVVLLRAVAVGGDLPAMDRIAGSAMIQAGIASEERTAGVGRMLQREAVVRFEKGSVFDRVLTTGRPWVLDPRRETHVLTFPENPGVTAMLDLGVHSLMLVPLRARGTLLGILVASRAGDRAAFSEDDLDLAKEIAGRASVTLDNARLYARERDGALVLQRSLLPRHIKEPPGVQIGHRYVPATSGTEAGGDWFDVIPLAGGHAAFAIGDVMGHGLSAAATMGRLRSAIVTLAHLDMPPGELLRRVNQAGEDINEGREEPLMATGVYVRYDPGTRECVIAKAGHVPPILLTREEPTGRWEARPVQLPEGTPLGLAAGEFEESCVAVPEGAILVLYTDGLIERRGEDITDGIDRLCAELAGVEGPMPSLDALCDRVVGALTPGNDADDVALLAVRLGGVPDDSTTSWMFPAHRSEVARARTLVRRTLLAWALPGLVDTALLLVSELFTNALRYADGPVGVRLVRGEHDLLVEVSDPLPDPPRVRHPALDDEGGRGLQLVSRAARRWGTRQGPIGKTVWFELTLRG